MLAIISRRPAAGEVRMSRRTADQLHASRKGVKATGANKRAAPSGKGSEERAECNTSERTRAG
jgi:hypothetical protein